MKNLIITLIAMIVCVQLKAQELPQLNSYMYNQYVYNPASGGMYDTDFNAGFATRVQWTGVSGAPITGFAWADHRFRKNSMSAGLAMAYDQIAFRRFTDIAANYTYIVRLTNKLKLSMGLRAGMTTLQWNPENGKVWDNGDVLANQYTMSYPKFGTGFQLYTRKFYVSLGVPDIATFNNDANAPDKGKNFFQKNRNYILMSGYRFKLSDAFGLYPNIKVFYYQGPTVTAPRVDGSMLFEIIDYFWAGANYASTGQLAAMAGTYVSSRVRFMYAYEFPLKPVAGSSVPLNVHEVNLFLQLDDLFARKNKTDIVE
ncbi:MAG: PorP/SprF family type IX secretion system membrane protein [Bacteroidota bacterium]|nr:PorP/SprF family type IX secretion system membrane protein [Bacteroidota bacterium]